MFKFDLEAREVGDGNVDVYVVLELSNGDRTRWTSGGLSREHPPGAGKWKPHACNEEEDDPLLLLSAEEALGLANELYAALGLTEPPKTVEDTDPRDTSATRNDELLEFFGTYDTINLERNPK